MREMEPNALYARATRGTATNCPMSADSHQKECCPARSARRKLYQRMSFGRMLVNKIRGPARLALTISSDDLCCQTIQTGSIAYHHPGNLRLWNSREVFGNLLPRVRES